MRQDQIPTIVALRLFQSIINIQLFVDMYLNAHTLGIFYLYISTTWMLRLYNSVLMILAAVARGFVVDKIMSGKHIFNALLHYISIVHVVRRCIRTWRHVYFTEYMGCEPVFSKHFNLRSRETWHSVCFVAFPETARISSELNKALRLF